MGFMYFFPSEFQIVIRSLQVLLLSAKGEKKGLKGIVHPELKLHLLASQHYVDEALAIFSNPHDRSGLPPTASTMEVSGDHVLKRLKKQQKKNIHVNTHDYDKFW